MTTYFYLHGFASSPQSAKARYFTDRFQDLHRPLIVPDLNQSDFYSLTLTRQCRQVQALLPGDSVTLIGSSFGGLTAAWIAETCPQVDRLILLAPAFGFLSHWLPKLGQAQMQRWQQEEMMQVYHYGAQRWLPLSYSFVTDLMNYADQQLQRPVATLILHGLHDEVIPMQASRNYAAQRPWVELIEVDSDHALANVQAKLWDATQRFIDG